MTYEDVIAIADDLGMKITSLDAQAILDLAEGLKEEDEQLNIDDIQEAIEDYERQCEEDNKIMWNRKRKEFKTNNFREKDW